MFEKHYNRIKRQQPKKCKFWCIGCDRFLLNKGQKCPICGYKEQRKYIRKK